MKAVFLDMLANCLQDTRVIFPFSVRVNTIAVVSTTNKASHIT